MRTMFNEIIDGPHKKISLPELHPNFKFKEEEIDCMKHAYRLESIKNYFQVLI